jgi:hypothetical protein
VDWFTKDYDSRRSQIGVEGLSSIYQVKEKREERQPQVGFNRAKPHERVASYKVFCTILEVLYVRIVNVLNLHIIDLARKYHTHLQREIEKEEIREKEWKNSH